MGRRDELWFSTGSSPRLPKSSAARKLLSQGLPKSFTHDDAKHALEGLIEAFGTLGESATKSAISFEDASMAIEALRRDHGHDIFKEPEVCVFCDEPETKLVIHHLDTRYLDGVPIWTRVCSGCEDQPLCPKTPEGDHEFISASHEEFKLKNTVVIDLDRLEEVGHCRRCGLPLEILDGRERYWTAQSRGRLMNPG